MGWTRFLTVNQKSETRYSRSDLSSGTESQPIPAPLKPFSTTTHLLLATMLTLDCVFAHSQALTHLFRVFSWQETIDYQLSTQRRTKKVCQGLRVSANAIKCEHNSKEEVYNSRGGLERG